MVRLLCLFPVLDVGVNSIAEVPLYLGRKGHVIRVLTTRSAATSKGTVSNVARSEYTNVTICRPYKSMRDLFSGSDAAKSLAIAAMADFRPDVILCSLQHNMPLARGLAEVYGVPIVLHVEFAADPCNLLPVRGMGVAQRLHMGWAMKPFARMFWRGLMRSVAAAMTTNAGDIPHLKRLSLYGREVTYVPWCNQVPEMEAATQELDVGVHIGGLTRFKNAQQLPRAIEMILSQTATRRFVVIGPGPYGRQIQELASKYPGRVDYREYVPREEALRVLANSGYGLLTSRDGALGFIGDCRAMRLPLVSLHNPRGVLTDNKDAIVTGGVAQLVPCVNRLLSDASLRSRVSEGAHVRYLRENTARSVGDHWEGVLQRVLESRGGCIEDG